MNKKFELTLVEAITLGSLGAGIGLLFGVVYKDKKIPLYFALGAAGSSILWHQIMQHPISYEYYHIIAA